MKLNLNLSNRAVDKLYNLLNVTRPWKTYFRTKEIVEEIVRHFYIYQLLRSGPFCFKATLRNKNKLIVGEELSLDLIFLMEELYCT